MSRTDIADATCLACSCMCDDIGLRVISNRVTEVRHACAIGQAWFRQQEDTSRAVSRIRGEAVTLAEGIAEAARLLSEAYYPLIYGFGETTCEAQQRAVSIADWIGGTIDTATSFGHAPSIMAFQNV